MWLQQGAGPEAGRKDHKGQGQEFEVIEMFLIVLELSSVCTYIKICQMIHVKYMPVSFRPGGSQYGRLKNSSLVIRLQESKAKSMLGRPKITEHQDINLLCF